MAGVKQILAFETSDGHMFKDENVAKVEQRKIDIKTKLNSLVESECWNGMNKDDVLNFLIEKSETLETIFK